MNNRKIVTLKQICYNNFRCGKDLLIRKTTGKIIIIIIFIGVFIGFIVWGKNYYGSIDIEGIKNAIVTSLLAYFVLSFIGLIMKITNNILSSIIYLLVMIAFFPITGKKLSEHISEYHQLIVLIALFVFILIWDVIRIIKIYRKTK